MGNTQSSCSLHKAAKAGDIARVKALFQGGADVNAKDEYKRTVLLEAAGSGHLDVVRYLVEAGADVNAKSRGGITALMRAAGSGHLNVVRYLVEQGADKVAKKKYGDTALIEAAEAGRLNVVRYLVEQGADVNAKSSYDGTALMKAALNGHLDVVRYLVEQGTDVNSKSNNGWTALMFAAHKGHLDVVRHLVEQDADINNEPGFGETALMLAAGGGHLDVVRYLVEQGADKETQDNDGKTALRTAAVNGKMDVVKYLVRPALFEPEEGAPSWFIQHGSIDKSSTALAHGGFGTVYCAKWAGNDVVVKEISDNEMRRFRKEVELWRKLTHPNVVQFFGANHRVKPYFIVSKFASNGELVPYLKREKDQGRPVVWRKLKEVATGLGYLHQQGIVHGDLKGNNIVVSKDGVAMLTDFGLSFSESGSCSVVKMKDTLGAMAWRAPEFAMMTVMTPTRKSDVYSLGMCIIEAVTYKNPWSGYTNDEIRASLRDGEILVKRPDELTDAQWALVQRMIAFSPDDRPDMADVLRDLDRFAENEQCDQDCPLLSQTGGVAVERKS